MRSESGHLGTNLAVVGIVTALGAGALAFFGASWAWWAGCIVWWLAWLSAVLGLADGPSRAFLAGTLRRSTFTQIYTALTKRNVLWLWGRLCDPVADRASVPTLFRAALTGRLYVAAVLLALAYPLLLAAGQWVATGEGVRVGGFTLLEAASFWPLRMAMLCAVLLAGLAVALRVSLPREKPGLGLPGILAMAALMLAAGLAAGTAGWASAALVSLTVELMLRLDWRGRALVTVGLAAICVVAAIEPGRAEIIDNTRFVLVFLLLLPLLNALFDTVSYATTLTLLRRGLRSRLPLVWGLLDLALACVLFLALGATLVAVVEGLNRIAGVPLIDLGALFAGIRTAPGEYWWLYLMLFSTVLPTALHFVVSLLGVQGLWPRAWRRPVAGWVEQAPQTPLIAVRAGLGLSVIWTGPILVLGGIAWLLWTYAKGLGAAVLGWYFDRLLWIAHIPVGAF